MYDQNENSLPLNNFDEKPIGKGQTLPQLSQYPSDFNPNDIQIQAKSEPLPLAKRIQSKVWKMRKEAFQQLLKQVTEDKHVYDEYQSQTIKFITDPNHMCQERALKILNAFLEKSDSLSSEPKPLIKALIEKCLVVEKNDIAGLSTETMFWMMDHYRDILLKEVSQAIENKNPKISASALSFLQKLVHNYGMKKLKQLQNFQKNFTILANLVRPSAKPQSISLFKEIFRWAGQQAFSFSMHRQVQDEVQKFAKTYVKEPMIIKRGLNAEQIKSKQPVVEVQECNDENVPPADVLGPYDSRWVDKVLQIQKWKQKKQQLDQFIKKTNVKKILPRDNAHYITLIKRLFVDNNINILQCGFKIVRNLCKGLKKNFTHPCKVFQGLVFSKLKDTKNSTVEDAHQTLKTMMNSITIDDLQEEIKEGLHDKAANMRLQSLKFLKNMIGSKDKKMMGTYKNLTSSFCEMNQDGSSEVRDMALQILCKLKGLYGLNFFGDKLKKLPQKKLQTIHNYIDPSQPQQFKHEKCDMDIEEQYIPRQKQKIQKPVVHTNNHQTQKQKVQQDHHQIPESSTKRGNDFESPIENIRHMAYQTLLQKPPNVIQVELFEAFKNKMPMMRQSSIPVLKTLLALVKKTTNTINIQHIEFLLYHDWKKGKYLITELIQASKLSLPALEYVKNCGMFMNSSSSTGHNKKETAEQNQGSSFSLKSFISSLQSFIPKMSSPTNNLRLQAADSAINLIKSIPPSTSGQLQSQTLNQFYNVLKCRVQDANDNTANKYIELVSELLSKGFLIKHRGSGKQIVLLLIQKLGDKKLANIAMFINEMIKSHSQVFWQYLSTQICKQSICGPILSIIEKENQSFFKYADQKSYILPLLTCISNDIETRKVEELLSQIVEINGDKILQKIIKESKLPNLENYARKWNITIQTKPIPLNPPSQQTINSSNSSILSKIDRINNEIDNPWPLTPSPSHIIKLMGTLISFGQPFSSLSVPLNLSQQEFQIVNSLTPEFLEEYSDLLVKWIFWRVHIESSPSAMECVLGLGKKLLLTGFQLHESEVVILLGALSRCLIHHKNNFMGLVCQINNVMNDLAMYKEKAFRFWINSFNDSNAPIDEILHMMIHSCADMIPSEMVKLARFPAVVKNVEFNKYLRQNYSEKLLIVYGFQMPDSKKRSTKTKSENIIIENLDEKEVKYFKEFFQLSSSNEVIEKIIEHMQSVPENQVMGTHLKIMYSIILPYLNRELSFINVYNYFKHLQTIIQGADCAPYLLNLVRTLAFFLIDLDEIKLQNNSEMLKTINKIILIILEITEPKHILEVLFIMLREQLGAQDNSKLNLLLPKCVGKVIKYPEFRKQYERNSQVFEWLKYIIKEIKDVIICFEIAPESPVIKTLKNLLLEIITMYPQTSSVFSQILEDISLNTTCTILFGEIIQQKSKQQVNAALKGGSEDMMQVMKCLSSVVEKQPLTE